MSSSTIDLLDLDGLQRMEHHEMFRRLRAERPVSWQPLPDGDGFWNVVKHADVVEVNRDAERFSSERNGISIPTNSTAGNNPDVAMLIELNPPRHTRYRLLVNKGFTPRMVGVLEQFLRHRSCLIVDNVIERGSCDFVVDLASELPLQAIAEIIGVPMEDRCHIFAWSDAIVGADDPEFRGDEADFEQARISLFEYVNRLATEKRRTPHDDIATKLLGAEIEGDQLSELDFDLFMLLLLVAGNETTRNATSWGMCALIDNPDQYRALRETPDELLPTAVDEMIRWATPVHHFLRTAIEETEIHGQTIAENDNVVIWYTSANRDENVFADPFRFDIERTPNPHVSFGGGGHRYCLGANLARMERLIFEELLERIPEMRLAGDVELLRSNFLAGIKHMPVEFSPGRRRGR